VEGSCLAILVSVVVELFVLVLVLVCRGGLALRLLRRGMKREDFVLPDAADGAGGLDDLAGVDGDGEFEEAAILFEAADRVVGLEAAEFGESHAVFALGLSAEAVDAIDALVVGEEGVYAEFGGEGLFGFVAAAEGPSGTDERVSGFGLEGVDGLEVAEEFLPESF
jgi:hypothetical protein